eukprot:1534301-Rhodomonas_salina.1
MRQNIQKLSGPTLQGASVPGSGSKQYVPPVGTAQAQVAMKRTPASTGITFAQQVFGPQTSNGFGFSAMSASHHIDKDALPIPTSEDHDLLSQPGSLSAHPLLHSIHEHGWWYFQVVLMTIGLFTSLYAVYSTTVGVLTTFSHVTTVMSTALAFPLSNFRSRDRPRLTMNQTQLALSAISGVVSPQHVYFLDSGCSYTILSNASVFRDLHEIPPVTIEGLTGTRVLTQGGTLTLTVPDFNGNAHEIEIENALYDPLATVSLISVKQMNNAGYGFALMPNESASAIITPPSTWPSTLPVYLPIIQQNNVFMLSEIDTEVAPELGNSSAYNASRFSHHTLEEILHRRYNHAPTERIAKMNGKVRGLPRPIRNTRTTHKSFCSSCDEANATRQNFSDSSDTVYTKDADLWQWDMFEMGEEYLTLDGNRYATIFVSCATRFVLLFLHKDKTGDTVATMLNQARAKFGYWPAFVRSDNAPEYDSPEVNAVIIANNIERQWSNPHQQEQNAAAETIVNMIGRG